MLARRIDATDTTCQVSVIIAADVGTVFDLVTDLSRMGEWSPNCKACWLDEGGRMEVGQWFSGRNEQDGQTNESRNQIVALESGRAFAFHTGGDLVRWQYDFAPADGGTILTESWTLLRAGLDKFDEVFGDLAATQIAEKKRWAQAGITSTLEAIKRAAESAS